LAKALLGNGATDQAIEVLSADLSAVFRNPHFGDKAGAAWIAVQTGRPDTPGLRVPPDWRNQLAQTYKDAKNVEEVNELWKRLSITVPGLNSNAGMVKFWIPHLLNKFVELALQVPEVVFVPAYRELTSDVQDKYDANGKGFVTP
jgi:hypothetical protein